jgi:hypothetical protein
VLLILDFVCLSAIVFHTINFSIRNITRIFFYFCNFCYIVNAKLIVLVIQISKFWLCKEDKLIITSKQANINEIEYVSLLYVNQS